VPRGITGRGDLRGQRGRVGLFRFGGRVSAAAQLLDRTPRYRRPRRAAGLGEPVGEGLGPLLNRGLVAGAEQFDQVVVEAVAASDAFADQLGAQSSTWPRTSAAGEVAAGASVAGAAGVVGFTGGAGGGQVAAQLLDQRPRPRGVERLAGAFPAAGDAPARQRGRWWVSVPGRWCRRSAWWPSWGG
jgi:hypothetical protein